MPITCFRLAGMTGHRGPTSVLTLCGCLLSLSGAVNLILFSFTRSVVCIKSLPGRVQTSSQRSNGYSSEAQMPSSRRQSYLSQLKRDSVQSLKRHAFVGGNASKSTSAILPPIGSVEWALRQSPALHEDFSLAMVSEGRATFVHDDMIAPEDDEEDHEKFIADKEAK